MRTRNVRPRTLLVASVFAAAIAATSIPASAQVRVGATVYPKTSDGSTRRYPAVAYDEANDAYLVVWGLQNDGARYVSAAGAVLGAPVAINSTTGGPVRVTCGTAVNECLISWLQEPTTIMGRLVRYNGGSVLPLTAPFVINSNGVAKLTSNAPTAAFSSSANEFLVAWTQIGSSPDVKAQRISSAGAKVGGEIIVAGTSGWEGFPTATYNSVQNEFVVGYYFETSGGTNCVAIQRVQPGTGALIGGRSTVYTSSFDQYPEIAFDSQNNRYLLTTWGWSGNQWMLHGRMADSNGVALGSSTVALALKGGGDGIGVSYNPVSHSYFAVYQSQTNAEVWGVEISSSAAPGTQIQVTSTGTTLAVQPRSAGSSVAGNWLGVGVTNFTTVAAQLVGTHFVASGTGSGTGTGTGTGTTTTCTTTQPGANWTCVNGNWLPPTTTTTTCTTASPGTGWTCVNGSWLPPTTTTSTCTTTKPGTNWTCVNGNWLPPTTTTSTCTTASPGTGWTCVSGSWYPPTTSTSTCTTTKPGANWTCVNGNWLPPS